MAKRFSLRINDKPAPVAKPDKYRCATCGVSIPKLLQRPFICSVCADDPCHGTDGLLVDILKEMNADAEALLAKQSTLPHWQRMHAWLQDNLRQNIEIRRGHIERGEAHLARATSMIDKRCSQA